MNLLFSKEEKKKLFEIIGCIFSVLIVDSYRDPYCDPYKNKKYKNSYMVIDLRNS